jgi:hypothetical protein
MTIGWVNQIIDGGIVVDGLEDPKESMAGLQLLALVLGALLSGTQTPHFLLSSEWICPLLTPLYLTGAMMSLSLIAVPVFLDTTKTAGQLVIQWARTYHYGHIGLPALCITTLLLYLHIGLVKLRLGYKNWRVWLVAGGVTVLMVPFTWIFMAATNDILFGLEAQAHAGTLQFSLADAQSLVKTWSMLHASRTLFPLAGTMLGLMAYSNKLRF